MKPSFLGIIIHCLITRVHILLIVIDRYFLVICLSNHLNSSSKRHDASWNLKHYYRQQPNAGHLEESPNMKNGEAAPGKSLPGWQHNSLEGNF